MSSLFCEENAKTPAADAAGVKIADSDFDFFFGRAFRDWKHSSLSLRE